MMGLRKSILWCCENGAKVNVKGRDGGTALWWAVSAREYDAVWALCEHGANPHTRNKDGISALRLAVERLDPKCVGMLLEKGAKFGEKFILEAVCVCKKKKMSFYFTPKFLFFLS